MSEILINEDKLDSPVWNSLKETHANVVIDYNNLKFYNPEYCPFGSFTNAQNTTTNIEKYSQLSSNFFIVGNKPELNNSKFKVKLLVCNQMILKNKINIETTQKIVHLQSKIEKQELFDLVNLVQPGYYRMKTAELGNYYGIYKENKLIAAAGERMKMDSFTEISAVVTHPEHTGSGYAKQLISHTTNLVFEENKIPYLHVSSANLPAIGLYEKLGFVTRKKVNFWNVIVK